MHNTDSEKWKHDHTFGQDRVSRGERGTLLVAALTAVFMVVEISAGVVYGSMALLADGLHMGSHALALGIAVAAYIYARRQAGDKRFSFGTGKVNALGGFTGALLLAVFAMLMAWESTHRFFNPVAIVFDQAIAVAIVGLLVNGVSVLLLGVGHGHGHGHDHDHEHDHGNDHGHGHTHGVPEANGDHGHVHDQHRHDELDGHPADGEGHGKDRLAHEAQHDHQAHSEDHNLRSAYLHVIADALTSFAAIFALVGGKFLGLNWLDPVMGILGSILVAHWSWGLLSQSSRVLLDYQAPVEDQQAIRTVIEASGDARVTDLHVWSIGPAIWASSLTIVAQDPLSPTEYKAMLPANIRQGHVTVEIHQCPKTHSQRR